MENFILNSTSPGPIQPSNQVRTNPQAPSAGNRNQDPITPLIGILGLLAAIVLLMLLTGCRSTSPKYLPVETNVFRTDTVRHVEIILQRDSIRQIERIYEQRLDSVAPILDSLGRMIGFDRWHIIDRSASLNKTDQRLLATVDSLRQESRATTTVCEPYPIEIPVETNRLNWWQKSLMAIGLITLLLLLLLLGGSLLSHRLRKKQVF